MVQVQTYGFAQEKDLESSVSTNLIELFNKCIERLDLEVPNWKGKIINGSVTKLPFENQFFDAVIDNQCISCLDFEDAKKSLC